MKIAIFDHNKNPFPIQGYGGGERIIQTLYRGLLDLGHEVTLIAIKGSTINYRHGKIIQLPAEQIEELRFGKINLAMLLAQHYDIFVCSCSGKNAAFDLNGFTGKVVSFCFGDFEESSGDNVVFVSFAQFYSHLDRSSIKDTVKNKYLSYPGLDENDFYVDDNGPHDRIVWLGGISPVKGAHFASLVAKLTGERVLLAGNIVDQDYFDKSVSPEIGKTIDYCGEIKTEKDKCNFFSQAKCYLHLANFCEPFGLTTAEAQMCGVPTIALNRGSAIEINYTKEFVYNSFDEMAALIKSGAINNCKRQLIRDYCIKRFGKFAFTNRMLEVFNTVLSH